MKLWPRILVLVTALVLINAATWAVILENGHNGVYPMDGDSIGIPIMSTLVASAFVLPLLVLIGSLPCAGFVSRLCSRGPVWGACVAIVLLALYSGAAIFAVDGVGYWSIPNHYSIAFCYLLLSLVLALFFVLDARRLFANLSYNGPRSNSSN